MRTWVYGAKVFVLIAIAMGVAALGGVVLAVPFIVALEVVHVHVDETFACCVGIAVAGPYTLGEFAPHLATFLRRLLEQ